MRWRGQQEEKKNQMKQEEEEEEEEKCLKIKAILAYRMV